METSTFLLPRALALLLALSSDPRGEWAGWLYMDDGDVPVRLHIAEGDAGLEARIDLPAAGQIDVRLASAELAGGALRITHPEGADDGVSIEVGLGGDEPDHLRGTVAWFGVGGRVELHRAASKLVWEDPAVAAAAVGLYGPPDGPGLIVRAQPWGELVLVDPDRGDERTLFPRPDGSHVVGPAFYVPGPMERELRFERDGEGAVTALVERTRETERRLPRRALVEEPIRVERDGAVLVGTLTIPDRPYPACAVLAGGGIWTDRSAVRPFALLLAAHGVASVAYDKRGHGASGGEPTVSFATTAADLRAFADVARGHPALGPVGYAGFSRGGWYGPLAAAEDPECAFLVDVVGPAVSPIEQETTARLDRMVERGASADDLALGERYLRAMWRFTRTGEAGERYLALRVEIEAAGWLAELHGPPDLDPAEWEWMRLNGDFDPRPSLRALRCPVLALYGDEDLSVAARVNAPLMRDALWASEAEPCRVLVLPGCDHSLHEVAREPDGRRVPFHRSPGRHPAAWSTIGSFLADVTR